MAVGEAVVITVLGIIILEGTWLAVLTYLLWRKRKGAVPPSPPEESKPA
jgi:hypothetical protein